MLLLINVIIANSLSDSTRNVILTCHANDNFILNNLSDIAKEFIDLDLEFSQEYIISINVIQPINISSTKEFSDKVDDVFICQN